MTPKFGWKKDRFDHRDRKFSLCAPALRADAPPPIRASLRANVPPVLSQLDNDCVANASASAVSTVLRAEGGPTELPSRRFIYWLARAQTGSQTQDEGTYVRDALKTLHQFGFPPEHDCPYDPTTTNSPPPAMAYRTAFDRRLINGYCRIDAVGAARVTAVKQAIAAGHPVIFGTLVSDKFLNAANGQVFGPPKPGDSIAGGHALYFAEYDDRVGPGTIRGPNSWGPDWGSYGWFEMSYDYVAWSETDDLWVVEKVPTVL